MLICDPRQVTPPPGRKEQESMENNAVLAISNCKDTKACLAALQCLSAYEANSRAYQPQFLLRDELI